MTFSARLLIPCLIIIQLILWSPHSIAAESISSQWKITSVKICRSSRASLSANLEAVGTYPVYSFFIPRPVWTVNGSVVDAQPIYDKGRLVAYHLLGASSFLKSGQKNTIKFSLPDQNSSKVFLFDQDKIPLGDCYEFF